MIPMHSELLGPALEWARGELSRRGEEQEAHPVVPTTTQKDQSQPQPLQSRFQMAFLMKQQPAATVGQFPKTHGLPPKLGGHPAAESFQFWVPAARGEPQASGSFPAPFNFEGGTHKPSAPSPDTSSIQLPMPALRMEQVQIRPWRL